MKTLRSIAIVFAVISAIVIGVSGLDSFASFKKPVDLYADDTDVTKLGRTDAVEADIYAVLDCFATETTTTKRNGAVTGKSKDYYYIVPAFKGDETYYIGVKSNSDDQRSYDKIADLTWAWLSGESSDFGEQSIHIEGCLKKMDKELLGYMKEWFEESEWFESEAEMEKYVLPVCLETVRFGTVKIMFLVGVGVFIVCAILIITGIISERKDSKKAKQQTHVVINGVSYPKNTFDHVNRCILNKEKIFAVQELRDITGLDLEEAQKIIDNWTQSYYWG